jgi:hypothetical protein
MAGSEVGWIVPVVAALRVRVPAHAEIPHEAEVYGVQLVAAADGLGVQVLGNALARLRMFGQSVARPRGRQWIGQRSQFAFQFEARVYHRVLLLSW